MVKWKDDFWFVERIHNNMTCRPCWAVFFGFDVSALTGKKQQQMSTVISGFLWIINLFQQAWYTQTGVLGIHYEKVTTNYLIWKALISIAKKSCMNPGWWPESFPTVALFNLISQERNKNPEQLSSKGMKSFLAGHM